MSRKVVSGPIRDKHRTKEKLIKTVGEIIKSKGFHELKITNIAKVAGVDKKLIYKYAIYIPAPNNINKPII